MGKEKCEGDRKSSLNMVIQPKTLLYNLYPLWGVSSVPVWGVFCQIL